MSFNVSIRTDNCTTPIAYYDNYLDREKKLEIDTEHDVVLTNCVNITITKSRNVFVNLNRWGPSTNPKIESCHNYFVINEWNVEIRKCVSSIIEVDKKYEVVELASNCDSLKKIIFTGSPFIDNIAYVLVKKGVKFDGVVENGGLRFEDEQQWCEWAALNHNRVELTTAEKEKLAQYHYDRKEYADSFWYAEKAVEGGSHKCAYMMANYWMQGWGVERDPFKGFAMYVNLALRGCAPSQHNLGISYLNGHGVKSDEKQGLLWIQRAALQGYQPAQDFLNSYKPSH